MPIVHIHMLAGRTPERIRELMARVTEAVSTALDVPPERVRVIVSEIPRTHWAVGGRPMAGDAPAADPPGAEKASP
ncbi:4-oxalocrotonate tautomerase family enzyme [Thermaerobacter marianensis DSM 12885]|uniref:Tautomerase n=1 Tax=Thermaerobacter marianensis (strain ATCC 700841 / DSM 12885 / JCM 10246 / 7p75a) TaxID=644966 RepID=E6SI07_THEM7|nr:4-oxalocrotonate tautomerase family enzyme [Thermaerobacter marianensis DSM 12885]